MEFLFRNLRETLDRKTQGLPVLRLFLISILLGVLPLACTPVQKDTILATPSPLARTSVTLPSASPTSQPASLQVLGPGHLQVTRGNPVQLGESLTELFVYTELGSFPLALRKSLAPEAVEAVELKIFAGDYAGQKLSKQADNFLVVTPKKPWTQVLKSKNRIQSAEGLVFVSPQGTLGFTIGTPTTVPPSWICIGQLQVLPNLLAQWRKPEKHQDVVRSIGYPAN